MRANCLLLALSVTVPLFSLAVAVPLHTSSPAPIDETSLVSALPYFDEDAVPVGSLARPNLGRKRYIMQLLDKAAALEDEGRLAVAEHVRSIAHEAVDVMAPYRFDFDYNDKFIRAFIRDKAAARSAHCLLRSSAKTNVAYLPMLDMPEDVRTEAIAFYESLRTDTIPPETYHSYVNSANENLSRARDWILSWYHAYMHPNLISPEQLQFQTLTNQSALSVAQKENLRMLADQHYHTDPAPPPYAKWDPAYFERSPPYIEEPAPGYSEEMSEWSDSE